jgi:hypothetical protein
MKIKLELQFPYPAMNEVMKVVKANSLNIISQEMALDCMLPLSFRAGLKAEVLEKLEEVEALSIRLD